MSILNLSPVSKQAKIVRLQYFALVSSQHSSARCCKEWIRVPFITNSKVNFIKNEMSRKMKKSSSIHQRRRWSCERSSSTAAFFSGGNRREWTKKSDIIDCKYALDAELFLSRVHINFESEEFTSSRVEGKEKKKLMKKLFGCELDFLIMFLLLALLQKIWEIRQCLSKLRLSWWKLHPHDEDCKLEECCRVVRTCALQSQFRPFWNTSLSSPWSSVPSQWTCHSRSLSSFCIYEKKIPKLSQTCHQSQRKSFQNSQILIVSYQLTQLRLCHELILICTLVCTRKQNHSEKHKAKDGEFHFYWFDLFLFDYHKLSQLHDDS